MRFLDECIIIVQAGRGGNGCVAFRREKYVPFGGPAGGDGGRGGDVVLVGDPGLRTLYDLRHQRTVRAEHGQHGQGKDRYGRSGRDTLVRVPLGTVVHEAETHSKLFELLRPGDRVVAAHGGRGGRGNKHFATPTDRAPRRADPGEPGEERTLRLELKLLADVGLVGLPNVGKSTLIRAVSHARPKVADYPFTTLEPHLGVVHLGDTGTGLSRTFVMADVPGLVPKASQGVGLGFRFLRHLERTRVLLHLVTASGEPGRTPLGDYRILRDELRTYSPELWARTEVVAMTKSDLPETQATYQQARDEFARAGIQLRLISAATRQGLPDLMQELGEQLGI